MRPLSPRTARQGPDVTWEDAGGRFTVGAALELDGLIEAGIEQADVFLAATRGDNTNLVIAQIAQRRFNVPRVVVRVADPARAAWYAEQGLHTICPTQVAIDQAEQSRSQREEAGPSMYVIIAGAGKVGWNLARELIAKDCEVTLIESDHDRYRVVEEELEHAVQYGDASELWVLERAGIQRADLVIAVTGDDEDNILICQVAKEKYGCRADRRPRQQPAQPPAFQAARDSAGGVRNRSDPAADRARGPRIRACPAAGARGGAPGDHRARGRGRLRRGRQACPDVALPDGALIISILRDGAGFVPKADTVIEAGDQVLLILDPGLEAADRPQFAAAAPGRPLAVAGPRRRDRLHGRWTIALIGGGSPSVNCARWLREARR